MRTPPIRRRLVAVAVAIAAIGAACGGTDAATPAETTLREAESIDGQDGTAADGSGDGEVDLGEVEATKGPGSLVIAAAEVLIEAEDLGDTWLPFLQFVPSFQSCAFLGGEASARQDFVDFETNDSVSIRVSVFADEASAADALAATSTNTDELVACSEETYAFFDGESDAVGVWNISTDDPLGVVQAESLLPDEDAYSRLSQLSADGGGSTWELEVASTIFRRGRSLVFIEVALADGDLAAVTRQVRDNLGPIPDDVPSDPALDASVDRLRQAVLGPDSPADFYQRAQAALLEPGAERQCETFGAAEAHLHGPVWVTANGISGLRQEGWSFPDEATAAQTLVEIEQADLDCVFDLVADELFGEVEQTGTDFSWQEVDGQQVATVTITMIQRSGGAEADVQAIFTFAQRGTEVLGWEFLGFIGDEPDLAALTAAAIAAMEQAR